MPSPKLKNKGISSDNIEIIEEEEGLK